MDCNPQCRPVVRSAGPSPETDASELSHFDLMERFETALRSAPSGSSSEVGRLRDEIFRRMVRTSRD